MKNLALAILLISTLAFGFLYLEQTRKTIEAQTATDALRQTAAELQGNLEEQEKRTTKLRDDVVQTHAEADAKAQETIQLRQKLEANLAKQKQAQSGVSGG